MAQAVPEQTDQLDFLPLLEREVDEMTTAFAAADADAPVAACPGWVVRDVAQHIIAIHRWVRESLDRTSMPDYVERPAEGDGSKLARAYADGAGAMVARMRELPADHECWTFNKHNKTAGFWHRRQLHEISVHRFDLAPYALSEDVAADGIDEAVDFFVPRMLHTGRATLPEGSLRLISPSRTWTIGEGAPESVAQGSAADLLLSLWGRADLVPAPWRDAKLMP